MKPILISLFFLLFGINLFAQNLDLIVTDSNDSIYCRIDSVTESVIFYRSDFENGRLQLGLPLNEVESYTYDYITEIQYLLKGDRENMYRINDGTYRYLKQKYARIPYKQVSSDKYSPDAAFMLSLIPGCGHFYTGEPLRGLAFMGGMAGSFGAMVLGFAMAWDGSAIGAPFFFAGAAGVVVFYIWSMIDAVQVAKVKNLAIRNNDISLRILPNFEFSSKAHLPANNFGVKLVLRF